MFFNIIFNDIVPIFVVMALGYAGAKMNAFTPSQTQALNKVVLNFALPAALFVSITKATREMLFEDLTLTLVSLIGIVAFFFVRMTFRLFLFFLFFQRISWNNFYF